MKVKCPACGNEYLIQGEDRCPKCLHSMMQMDLPAAQKKDGFRDAVLNAPISHLLTGRDLLVAAPEDTIQQIVRIFQAENKNCVLVYKKKKLVGILSNRDILLKVAGKHKDLSKVKVQDVMTPNPEFVHAEDPIAFAVNKMAMGGFRHLPVIAEDGHPYSIILIKDVLGYLARRERAK